MDTELNGFWLPKGIRDTILTPETEYVRLSFARGRQCLESEAGAVTARWPKLEPHQWLQLLEQLRANRQAAPHGVDYWNRLQFALQAAGRRFNDPSDRLAKLAFKALPNYTGYSEAMIGFTLNALELMALGDFPSAFRISPRRQAGWQIMDGLPGRLQFYESSPFLGRLKQLLGRRHLDNLFGPAELPEMIAGFGAGNVPGTALMIGFLALSTTLAGGHPPVVVVKNSRREPIFTPLVLEALEDADPELASSLAVLVWDYGESEVQSLLLAEAGLVVAAASDETIAQIRSQVQFARLRKAAASANERRPPQALRFHAHGHKFSFAAISRSMMDRKLVEPDNGRPLLEVVALLAGLDSIFWDQYGCLSARVHFVEEGSPEGYAVIDYAKFLEMQLRLLATFLPRGASPRQRIMDSFDRYKLLETTGQVQVLSRYDDEFLVVFDRRHLENNRFYSLLNDCLGRVIFVRPVADLMEIPERYLRLLPAANLQSLSVAVGAPEQGLPEHFLDFAAACGACGVTAFRSAGRGAFPQLAYSWDGLIPLDLARSRPPGHFTTIEFNHPYEELLETYRMLMRRAQRHFSPAG